MWLSAQKLIALLSHTEHLITCFLVLLIAVFIRAVCAAILIVLNSTGNAVYRTVNSCIG
jgi:hypothetical protein